MTGKQDAAKPKKAVGKKRKIEGAALIGIDVAKEDDFAAWYAQVLTKGDMLAYGDISGCYTLLVRISLRRFNAFADTFLSPLHGSSGSGYRSTSTRRSEASASRNAHSPCSYPKPISNVRRATSRVSLQK